jgi:N-formylglutamate deformylase
MMEWLSIDQGAAPLIVSVPHAGTCIPADIADAVRDPVAAISDADFFVDRLYAFVRELGVTLISTSISRTVIDVNRDPAGVSLYPGQTTTGLCPTERFDGTPLYKPGAEPDADEIDRRRRLYFNPYHAALHAEIERLGALHPAVVLYDAHSILSRMPRLFVGELPQFNIGSFDGKSCAAGLSDAVSAACDDTKVVNGRFKGGWITRHYGAPARGIHAIQMELAMRGYLDEAGPWPPQWDEQRAGQLQMTLRRVIAACLIFARETI